MAKRLLTQSLVLICLLLAAACSAPAPPAAPVDAGPEAALRVRMDTPHPATPTPPNSPASPPTWPELRNLTYPAIYPAGRQAPLQDGVYRERTVGGGGVRELLVSLGDLAVFADLTGDGVAEAVVLLIEAPGGGDLQLNIVVVERRGAALHPLAAAPLGSGVVVEALSADAGDLLIYARGPAAGDAPCCPSVQSVVRLRLRDGALTVVERNELRRRTPTLPDLAALLPFRLELPAGGGRAGSDGLVGPGAIDAYQIRAAAGRELRITVDSPGGAAFLGLLGPDGAPLSPVATRARAWQGRLSGAGDYLVYVGADANVAYTLNVELAAPPAPAGPYRPEAVGERVVYLTFDDGPHPSYTPPILDLLARYNARATFFVLGRQVEAHPALTEAIHAAGHKLANHTYSHPALAGVGREIFLREVGTAQNLLGARASGCFRPPYGSLDANTYIYAAELGLRLVLWDVDPQDWALPGAGAIAARVLGSTGPGSIVLFHDGGGERSQTVAALATILAELSAQGYRFEALPC